MNECIPSLHYIVKGKVIERGLILGDILDKWYRISSLSYLK